MRRKRRKKSKKTQKQGSSNQKYVVGGGIVLAVAAIVGLLALALRSPETIHGLQHFLSPERGHDETVEYVETGLPPAGGIHSGQWQTCGIYERPVETKHAVHSLEHGAVWITYHPDLPAAAVESLRDVVRGESYLLLSPYPELASPIVLTAWGVQLEVEDVSDDRIAAFIDEYQAGPQTPEIGATCNNGVGTPIG